MRSNRGAIPSPQCALGTTPRLSIHQTARHQVEERRKERRGRENVRRGRGGRQREGAEDDGRGKNREITALFTPQERENNTASTAEQPGGDGKEMEMNQGGGEATAAAAVAE